MAGSMIERVARVLEPQAWTVAGEADSIAYRNRRTASLRKARAAIEAMREPTAASVSAGALIPIQTFEGPEATVLSEEAGEIYRTMIDAALKETA